MSVEQWMTLIFSEDEYITDAGEEPMPEGRTSILTGFYYISKLFRRT